MYQKAAGKLNKLKRWEYKRKIHTHESITKVNKYKHKLKQISLDASFGPSNNIPSVRLSETLPFENIPDQILHKISLFISIYLYYIRVHKTCLYSCNQKHVLYFFHMHTVIQWLFVDVILQVSDLYYPYFLPYLVFN